MSRGHDRERAIRRQLQEEGWVVVRATGSLGVADLVALKAGHTPRIIECKSTLFPYAHFGPTDRAMCLSAALQAGAEAWLCWWPSRGECKWIPSEDWPVAGKAKAVANALEQAA